MTFAFRDAIRDHPLFVGLGDEVTRTFLQNATERHYAPGDFILREGQIPDAYYCLLRGSVRIYYTSPEGIELTAKILGAPAAFGELELLNEVPCPQHCVAADDTICASIPKRVFFELLDMSPKLTRNLLKDTAARFLIAAQHERALAFLTVQQRLCYLLLSYVRLYGQPVADGVYLDIEVSQERLANDLGVARKSIVRAFTDLVAAAVLRREKNSYVILHVERLMELGPTDLLGIDWMSGTQPSDGLLSARRHAPAPTRALRAIKRA